MLSVNSCQRNKTTIVVFICQHIGGARFDTKKTEQTCYKYDEVLRAFIDVKYMVKC